MSKNENKQQENVNWKDSYRLLKEEADSRLALIAEQQEKIKDLDHQLGVLTKLVSTNNQAHEKELQEQQRVIEEQQTKFEKLKAEHEHLHELAKYSKQRNLDLGQQLEQQTKSAISKRSSMELHAANTKVKYLEAQLELLVHTDELDVSPRQAIKYIQMYDNIYCFADQSAELYELIAKVKVAYISYYKLDFQTGKCMKEDLRLLGCFTALIDQAVGIHTVGSYNINY
mgnify:CR=1 FL=1